MESAQDRRPTYQCGEWEVDLARRELRAAGRFVPIGGRAFEIVEVLLGSAGELVTKDDLMGRIWPGAIVEDNTLQVHISAVRKALGPDRGMLKTASGRGYRLVGDWTLRQPRASPTPVAVGPAPPPVRQHQTNLPATGSDLIGRAAAVERLRDLLSAYRIVTLTGPGGIGKTKLALQAARVVLPTLHGDAWLVELASLADPALVPSAVARVLGLQIGGDEISPDSVARAIGGNRLLLVLDTCEHVIDAAARLTETIVHLCPHTTVLATSQEVLRIGGEYVYRVPTLDVPPEHHLVPGNLFEHGAVQLFIARTQASESGFAPREADLATIAAICRRLDGIPLAIEFAAARTAAIGLHQVAAHLDRRFALLTGGRRTAAPRHQTLHATLDWSYDLLSEAEQRLLRHLAVFPGGCTLQAVAAVTGDAGGAASRIAGGISSLVSKSLVTFDGSVATSRWRLLDTIRAYALEKLDESGERETLAHRHAQYYRTHFTRLEDAAVARPPSGWLADSAQELDNVRAALDWSFASPRHAVIGAELTAAYVPVWRNLSLSPECRERCEHALLRLKTEQISDARLQMRLQIGLGASLLHTLGPAEQTQRVLTEALAIADTVGDLPAQLRALLVLSSVNVFRGDYARGAAEVERAAEIAQRIGDTQSVAVAERRMGTTLLTIGKLDEAQRWLERAVRSPFYLQEEQLPVSRRSGERAMSRAMLARVLWLRGFPDRALGEAQASIDDVPGHDHHLTMCRVLYFGMGRIAPMTGEFSVAEQAIATLIESATRVNARFWMTAGQFLRGKLFVQRHAYAEGLAVLRDAFEICRQTGWRLSYPEFTGSLALALAGLRRFDEACDAVGRAIESAGGGTDGQQWYVPELLRIKGEILLQHGAEPAMAANCLDQAVAMAREQGALSWELRIALSLAGQRMQQDRADDARNILAPVYDRFAEGFATADLRAARTMLDALANHAAPVGQ